MSTPNDNLIDKPVSAAKSVADAWQRACDKHGEEYANDIFPDGKPAAQPSPAAVEQALAEEKANQEQIGATVQLTKERDWPFETLQRALSAEQKCAALQVQRDELLAALRETARQARGESNGHDKLGQLADVADAAIARATEVIGKHADGTYCYHADICPLIEK